MTHIANCAVPKHANRNAILKAQLIAASRWLQVDESSITSPKDMMLLHRVRAAAAEGSGTFDAMLGDMDVNRLFSEGAIYIERR